LLFENFEYVYAVSLVKKRIVNAVLMTDCFSLYFIQNYEFFFLANQCLNILTDMLYSSKILYQFFHPICEILQLLFQSGNQIVFLHFIHCSSLAEMDVSGG